MSGAPDYSTNPFLPQPQPTLPAGLSQVDQARASGLRSVDAMAPRQGWIGPGGTVGDLSPYVLRSEERQALNKAPKKSGTNVTVEADPTPVPLADHMFIDYNDGQNDLIARGGPTSLPIGTVTASVTPAAESKDYRQGQRVMFRGFLPGVSADDAAEYARQHAAGINQGGNLYTGRHNSNSYAADVIEQQFGHRPGDWHTVGYPNRLSDQPPPSSPLPLYLRPEAFIAPFY